jgi:hypothetical protein
LCGKLLRRNEMELAAEFQSHDANPRPGTSYHFHPLCYLAWEFQRAEAETAPS